MNNTLSNNSSAKQSAVKSIPIFFAFLCMGFGDFVGPLVGLAKDKFTDLSQFEVMMITFMGFIMFGVLSIPLGIMQDKKGKKFILMMGLIVALVGLIIPMFSLDYFSIVLLSILFLGTGNAILQVAGNPIMRDVSPEGKYSRNLAFGQFVKAIGSLSGALIPFIVTKWILNLSWQVIFPVYSAIVLLTIVMISLLKVKEHKDPDYQPANFKSCFSLLTNSYVLLMVMAIFMYVGAEVCMSSGIPLYFEAEFAINIKELGILGTGVFFLFLLIGRFLGGIILTWLPPKKFFIITSVVSLLGLLGFFVGNKAIAIASVVLTGIGFANIFPLVFSITVDNMPKRSNELSGLMVTAIVGGAFIPPLMGLLSDYTTILAGFIVPVLCIIYIAFTAFFTLKKTT